MSTECPILIKDDTVTYEHDYGKSNLIALDYTPYNTFRTHRKNDSTDAVKLCDIVGMRLHEIKADSFSFSGRFLPYEDIVIILREIVVQKPSHILIRGIHVETDIFANECIDTLLSIGGFNAYLDIVNTFDNIYAKTIDITLKMIATTVAKKLYVSKEQILFSYHYVRTHAALKLAPNRHFISLISGISLERMVVRSSKADEKMPVDIVDFLGTRHSMVSRNNRLTDAELECGIALKYESPFKQAKLRCENGFETFSVNGDLPTDLLNIYMIAASGCVRHDHVNLKPLFSDVRNYTELVEILWRRDRIISASKNNGLFLKLLQIAAHSSMLRYIGAHRFEVANWKKFAEMLRIAGVYVPLRTYQGAGLLTARSIIDIAREAGEMVCVFAPRAAKFDFANESIVFFDRLVKKVDFTYFVIYEPKFLNPKLFPTLLSIVVGRRGCVVGEYISNTAWEPWITRAQTIVPCISRPNISIVPKVRNVRNYALSLPASKILITTRTKRNDYVLNSRFAGIQRNLYILRPGALEIPTIDYPVVIVGTSYDDVQYALKRCKNPESRGIAIMSN